MENVIFITYCRTPHGKVIAAEVVAPEDVQRYPCIPCTPSELVHGDVAQRRLAAELGYETEVLIQDPDPVVRALARENLPMEKKILRREGFKAFYGTMHIESANPEKFPPIDLTSEWLYKPEYDRWYGGFHSFPAEICSIKAVF